jgi:hypothetical protein
VPQLLAIGDWPDRIFGLQPHLEAELVNFQRNDGVTGQRLDLLPQGLFVAVTACSWLLQRFVDMQGRAAHPQRARSPAAPRTAPIVTLDAHAVLERTVGASQRIQTLGSGALHLHSVARKTSFPCSTRASRQLRAALPRQPLHRRRPPGDADSPAA